jgi:hypothetical protein
MLAALACVPWLGHRIVLATSRPPTEIVMATGPAGTPSHALGLALSERWAESVGLTVHVGPVAGGLTPTGVVGQELADLALTPEPVPLEDPVSPVLVLFSADGAPEADAPDQDLWAASALHPRVVALVVDDLVDHGGARALGLTAERHADQARNAHPGAVGMAELDGGWKGFLKRHGGAAVSVLLLVLLTLSARRSPADR